MIKRGQNIEQTQLFETNSEASYTGLYKAGSSI